jgi:hypothetical protein
LFPVLLFSQQTCVKVDFRDSYIMQMNVEFEFVFSEKYLELHYMDTIYYYRIKKRVEHRNYSIYWVKNYKLYVYPSFILQKRKYISIYLLCNKNLRS